MARSDRADVLYLSMSATPYQSCATIRHKQRPPTLHAGVADCLGLFSGLAGQRTFCWFDEWKVVFRRTSIDAKPPLFRPF